MKTKILLATLTISSLSFSQSSPVDYMNQISSEFKLIQGATWDYTKSVAKNKSAKKVNKNRLELVTTVQKSIQKVKAIGAFEGSTDYRDSVISYLNVNLAVVAEDYEKIMNMEDIAEQSYDLMDAYIKAQDLAGKKLASAGEMVDKMEHQFAEQHKITLIESSDKVSLKLKKASLVFDYYNPVYLIFFKSYKQEMYLLDALAKGDVSGMEQNKSALGKFADEGLELLSKIEHFNNDLSLKNACLDMIKFYKDEADKQFQKLIDFQTTKEAFEKAKTNLESKKEKERTQADVDEYNKMVKEYNLAIAEFNSTNTDLNNKRNKLINAWNAAAANFTNKHIM